MFQSITTVGISQHPRVKRHTRDEDLRALADAFSSDSLLDEEMRKAIESFEPNWDGLSRKEINGYESISLYIFQYSVDISPHYSSLYS